MMDLAFLALIAGLVGLTLALVRVCERV